MLPLAEWRFKEEYNIPFERDPLMYKDKNLPDAIKETIVPVAQLCSIEEGSNVDSFIDTVLLRYVCLIYMFQSLLKCQSSKVNLPAWMAGQLSPHLTIKA